MLVRNARSYKSCGFLQLTIISNCLYDNCTVVVVVVVVVVVIIVVDAFSRIFTIIMVLFAAHNKTSYR